MGRKGERRDGEWGERKVGSVSGKGEIEGDRGGTEREWVGRGGREGGV